MKGRLILLLVLLLLLSVWLASAEEAGLSLQECLHLALKNNPALGVKVAEVERRQGLLSQAKEGFFPQLTFSLAKEETDSPSFSWEAEDALRVSQQDLNASLEQALWFGGKLTFSIDSSRYESNERFQTINPYYGSRVLFKLEQPLLRGLGDRISRKEILLTRYDRNRSQNELRAAVADVVLRVEELYWNLSYAQRFLDVKTTALRLADGLLAKNRKMVETGLLAEIEILAAEAEVASRQAEIVEAQELLDNTRDELRSLLQLDAGIPLRASEEPQTQAQAVDLAESVRQAMANRPDYANAGIDLQSKNLALGVARNRLLPELNLNAQYWSPGISGDRLYYRNDDPLTGEVIKVVPGAASDSMRDALDFKYRNWAVYLSLGIPLNSLLSRGAFKAAHMERKQALLQCLDLERRIRLELSQAARSVGLGFLRIQAYRTARELAEKKLRAEEKRQVVGLSTSFVVLQYQRDFAQALSNELKALCDYNLALARLEKAQGTSLQAKSISLAEDLPVL